MKVALALIAVFLVAGALAQDPPQPIPSRYDGHSIGNDNALVKLEMFVDFMCPDSADAWPIIKQVLNHYGPTKVQLIMHVLPLPYHRNSFLSAQAGLVIEKANAQNFWKWTDLIFQIQQQWFNSPSANLTMNDVIIQMAKILSQKGLISQQDFVSGMSNDDLNWSARVSWKWATARGVYGTPMYMINGVINPLIGSDWTLAQWTQFLDPIVSGTLPNFVRPSRINM